MMEKKAQAAIGFSVVTITKAIMEKFSLNNENAFHRLIETAFYTVLTDLESGLYLESDEYLCAACLMEITEGKEAMYDYINKE